MEITRSEQIGKLTEALAKAQLNFKPATKDTSNPFFKSKYADLATLIDATRSALAHEGLTVMQFPASHFPPAYLSGSVVVSTIISHSSGEFIAHDLQVPVSKMDAQGIGSATTYARRYSYQSILNIAGEDDDDGNAAVGKDFEADFEKRTEGQLFIKEFQINAWKSALGNTCRSLDQLQAYFQKLGIERIEDMLRADFNDAMKWLLDPKVKDLEADLKDSVEHAKKQNGKPFMTKERLATLHASGKPQGKSHEFIHDMAAETYHVESLSDLNESQYSELLKWAGTPE